LKNLNKLEEWKEMISNNENSSTHQKPLCVCYNGLIEDVDSLKEGLALADDLINSEGGDVNIRQGEETIAYREWFSLTDDDSSDAMSAERDPIVYDGIGFYSDWVIDTDWEHEVQTDPCLVEINLRKGDIVKTNASDTTIVLGVDGDNALLFTGTQFIDATNCRIDESGLHWDFGKYYQEFSDIPTEQPLIQYQTFGELLNSDQELDCELIVGDEEMDMTFLWDDTDRITHYGYKQFKALMDCPYEVLPNGNIAIDDGNAEQGRGFVNAVAGYISHSESLRIFTKESELEADLWDLER